MFHGETPVNDVFRVASLPSRVGQEKGRGTVVREISVRVSCLFLSLVKRAVVLVFAGGVVKGEEGEEMGSRRVGSLRRGGRVLPPPVSYA